MYIYTLLIIRKYTFVHGDLQVHVHWQSHRFICNGLRVHCPILQPRYIYDATSTETHLNYIASADTLHVHLQRST